MAENEKEPEEQRSYARASKAIIYQRVQEIFQLKLKGAQRWTLLQYVANKEQAGEHPWTMDADNKPLCSRMIDNYSARADELVEQVILNSAKFSFHWHIAKRRFMFEKAIEQGDYQTALAIAKDEAALENHYPAKATKNEFTGRDGGPMELQHSGNVSHAPDLQSADVLFAESLSRRTTEINPESGIHPNGESEHLDNGRHSDNGNNA